jgi:F-type H+-transporting ATPase subunit delta
VSSDTTGVTGLAGRYATALYELAESQSALDQVADDLRGLDALINESADLNRMVRSPVISRDEQGKAMRAILDQAGASELTKNFVGVAAANRRLFAISDIIKGYLQILAGRRGEVTAHVTSATPLSDKQTAELESVLKRSMGGNVSINAKVDPDLLGGLVVRLGSRMVDSSIRTKLQQLRLAMRGVG